MLNKYSSDVIERAKKIKLLGLDVDGVLTDRRLILSSFGDELKFFDVNDGLGIYLVRRSGVKVVFLTAKASGCVKRRARELKVDKLYHDFHYKITALRKIRRKFRVTDEEICFIGDDLIDIPILKRAGLAVSPPNAMDEVRKISHLITEKQGGRGAVREVCDLILKAQGTWDKVTSRYFND